MIPALLYLLAIWAGFHTLVFGIAELLDRAAGQ